MAANAARAEKTIADPCAAYESMAPLWKRSRAACSGERSVKEFDVSVDRFTFRNFLIPFSPSMSDEQFAFYRAEAEWPGISRTYAKTLVGGLLRKKPVLELPEEVPEEAYNWLMNQFGKDNCPMVSFLDSALWEELQTARAWVFVDYPNVAEDVDIEVRAQLKPYPTLVRAEDIINWRFESDELTGRRRLKQVLVRSFEEVIKENEFHPVMVDTITVHEIKNGFYQVRKFQETESSTNVPVVAGKKLPNTSSKVFTEVEVFENILANGERITDIPAWSLNGEVDPVEPMLMPVIDKEISLYNKMSRRNHLLYGACTYTPVLFTDISDEQFKEIVDGGLGTWIKLGSQDKADILKTPTEALKDMEAAIASALEEVAKLGIRMLSPETAQSGIALELRNASQTAQIGTLNMRISTTITDVIVFMLNWRYDLQLTTDMVRFSLSEDFNPTPLGADWLRLVTEWYENGLIPRTVWLQILKLNDIIPPDYDDEEGQKEITEDETIVTRREQQNFESELAAQTTEAVVAAKGTKDKSK